MIPTGLTQERAEQADEPASKSTRTKALQGAVVFVAMFVVLYWIMSRRNVGEE